MGPEYIPKIERVARWVTVTVNYWYILTSNVTPQPAESVRRRRRAAGPLRRSGRTGRSHPAQHQVRHIYLDLRWLDRRCLSSALPRRPAGTAARGVFALPSLPHGRDRQRVLRASDRGSARGVRAGAAPGLSLCE